jgi:hypothetical protein
MNIMIKAGTINPISSQDLQELENFLSEDLAQGISRYETPSRKGEKEAILLTGLAIFGAVLTTVNTTINVLNYWAAKHKESTVTLRSAHIDVALGELSDSEVIRVSHEIVTHDEVEITVRSPYE